MRAVTVAAFMIFFSGCQMTTTQRLAKADAELESQLGHQIQAASGAVYATGVLLREGKNEEARQTTDFAQAALPKPTANTIQKWMAYIDALTGGATDALAQAYADLESSQERAAKLESERDELRSKLLAQEQEKARIAEEALLKEQENKRIQERQTMALTWFGGALAVVGVAIGWLGRHMRLGIITVALGVGLIVLGSMLARIPSWAGTAFTILGFVMIPAVGFYTYKVGLFQNPPENVGDFQIKKGDQ